MVTIKHAKSSLERGTSPILNYTRNYLITSVITPTVRLAFKLDYMIVRLQDESEKENKE